MWEEVYKQMPLEHRVWRGGVLIGPIAELMASPLDDCRFHQGSEILGLHALELFKRTFIQRKNQSASKFISGRYEIFGKVRIRAGKKKQVTLSDTWEALLCNEVMRYVT